MNKIYILKDNDRNPVGATHEEGLAIGLCEVNNWIYSLVPYYKSEHVDKSLINRAPIDPIEKLKVIIPTEEEFLNYARSMDNYKQSEAVDLKIKAKYNVWKANGWKNAFGRPIKNWQSYLEATISYLIFN